MTDTQQTPDWWASLKHEGLLLSPAQLVEHFSERPEPLSRRTADQLRREILRYDGSEEERGDSGELLDTVLEEVTGLGDSGLEKTGQWLKGPEVSPEWTMRAVTGEAIRPRRVWKNGDGFALPVFFDDVTRIGVGHGKRSAARVLEWLRKADRKLALLTNGEQWRLIYAGLDHDAYAQWDTGLWFEEGEPSEQVAALRALLGPRSLSPPEGDEDGALLLHAAEESRKGQADFSSEVGERVREAVEALIQAYSGPLDRLEDVDPQQIYLAATRVVMRIVVALFAESRDLLPRNNAIYHGSYGIEGLREELDRLRGSAGGERLRHRHGAWPRVVALFQLIHEGSPHESLPVPRYGGKLFQPGDPDAEEPIRKALAVFEDPERGPNDATVLRILDYLCKGRMKVRQGRRRTWVEMPVDFSALSTEYIGILYEGLLDYELRQAEEDDPVVFLNLGDEPALPLSRLEAMDEDQIESLTDEFKDRESKRELKEDAEEELEEDESDDEEEEALSLVSGEREDEEEDRATARRRAEEWALRAVEIGKLIRRPRSKTDEKIREWKEKCQAAAEALVTRVVLPGEWYLIRHGGTRKGSGTFYTRPQLAIPTVERTLRPLAYRKTDGGTQEADESVDPDTEDLTPRTPETILDLKVCDPACGSGSFLVGSLRYLTDALHESLWEHGRIDDQGERTLVTLAAGEEGGERLDEELLPTTPESEDFEERLKGRLKRYVVERCIYGVDIDPLAVELCRIALWIETMDRELPFTFLDHKIQCGDSLVGCWFDRFRDYPLMAWEREGADYRHKRGEHFEKREWHGALREFRKEVKSNARRYIRELEGQHSLFEGAQDADRIHDDALEAFEELHSLPIHQTEERAKYYQEHVRANPDIAQLKKAFDAWCALWFWPAEEIDAAPLPTEFLNLNDRAREIIGRIASERKFFHWELAFPDVFTEERSGFDAVVGNPPWETLESTSQEFFSRYDPLYRTYGKRQALRKQGEMFERSPSIERSWLNYNAFYKAIANYQKHAAFPFGDEEEGGDRFYLGSNSDELHRAWRRVRRRRSGYVDPEHPYRYQGSGKAYTYRMFLELSHSLLHKGGQLGMLAPSGLYADQGAQPLRRMLLENSGWRWLFGFENREGIFDIHRSYKFNPVIAEKGGQTRTVHVAFMRHDVTEWEDAEDVAIPYHREEVERLSPRNRMFLEVERRRTLDVLDRVYRGAHTLDLDGKNPWELQYQRGDFNMTSDSDLFVRREEVEEKGVLLDEYGRWLSGNWFQVESDGTASRGNIRSSDGSYRIGIDGIEEIYLPLYQGRMIYDLSPNVSRHVRGAGRRADWENVELPHQPPIPQYVLPLSTIREEAESSLRPRLLFRHISNATNERTCVPCAIPRAPCGDSFGLLDPGEDELSTACFGAVVMGSLVYDWALRQRIVGTNLSRFFMEETNWPSASEPVEQEVAAWGLRLMMPGVRFADQWNGARQSLADSVPWFREPWQQLWALTDHERLRIRAMLDAVVAQLFGLGENDLWFILRDCDHPVDRLSTSEFTQALDPKGFWRVDQKKEPELRHTVLTMVAFRDLQAEIRAQDGDEMAGVRSFLRRNGLDGWQVPETLRLDDFDLGHDERAKAEQPVRERLGPRFESWQLKADREQSWEECRIHAENIGQ